MREHRELLARSRELRAAKRPGALATLVAVEGSSYRREGARMLLVADGGATGVLSGGCLEADLQKAANGILADPDRTPRLVTYDLRAEQEALWGFGLGCSGKVSLLVEPLDGRAGERLERALSATIEQRTGVRQATVYATTPPADASVGETLLLLDDEPVKGPREQAEKDSKERDSIEESGAGGPNRERGPHPEDPDPSSFPDWKSFSFSSLGFLHPGEARSVRWIDPESDSSVALLVESLLPPPHLLVIGGERDVAPLLRLGRELGWETTVIDTRASGAAEARLAPLASYVALPVAGAASGGLATAVELSSRTAVVVATHRYLDDLAFLGELAGSGVGYLAVLGPVARRERLLADLDRRGQAPGSGALAHLRGPAGLALGGRSPEEVALAIVAEIQATLAGADARPLSEPR
jgi:xanthine/CO dehydrogenase XdhC/CoxF family maturation factor